MNGIVINIDPVIFHLGSLTVAWHGLFMVVGLVVAVLLSARLVARAGLSVDQFYTIALIGIPGGIIGARFIHVIDYWDYYMANPGNILAIQRGGLALWGGILGGLLAVLIYARIKNLSVFDYADRMAPGMILAQAIGRIGDVINGEHFSIGVGAPWGVVYTHPNSPALGLPPSHLAVGYEMVMDLVIFGVLMRLLGRIKPDGTLFLLYLASYSVGRFFLSFLRLDSKTVQLGLSQPQWLSLFVVIAVLVLFFYRRKSQTAD